MTCSFAVMGKSTAKRVSQKALISDSVPGSCAPKSLQGTPRTMRPSLRLCAHSDSRPEYCGVSPHWLATLTTSSALPLKFESGSFSPSIDLNSKSYALFEAIGVSRSLRHDFEFRSI